MNDKALLFVSEFSGFLKIWSILDNALLKTIKCYEINNITLYNDKFVLATGGDNSLKIIDIERNTVNSVNNFHKYISSISVLSGPKYSDLLISIGDCKIRLWKIEND